MKTQLTWDFTAPYEPAVAEVVPEPEPVEEPAPEPEPPPLPRSVEAQLYGTDLFGQAMAPDPRGALCATWGAPPFSVLSAREGEWQQRKRAWLGLGIRSELGRDDGLIDGSEGSAYNGTNEWIGNRGGGTSVFDPVLTELLVRWFCPVGGQVLDPFAGGSVRGIVSAVLGRKYWGCDLSWAQVAANIDQGRAIVPDNQPTWVCGDSRATLAEPLVPRADFLLSCPPYGNLEEYSEDPRDISSMEWPAFQEAHGAIIAHAVECLRPDRFAAWVVGNFRDTAGHYHDLVGATVRAFQAAGCHLYNEGVLLTPVGSLPVRVPLHFTASRKLGKAHQNILVFVKGSWRAAVEACKA